MILAEEARRRSHEAVEKKQKDDQERVDLVLLKFFEYVDDKINQAVSIGITSTSINLTTIPKLGNDWSRLARLSEVLRQVYTMRGYKASASQSNHGVSLDLIWNE